MSSDSITQQIQIGNDVSSKVKIKIYLHSLGAQENTADFLSKMKLTARQQGDSILFAAPVNKTGCILLRETTLDMAPEVPLSMGNDYLGQIGYIDWQFMVEQLPVEPSDPEPHKTGGTSNKSLVSGFMLLSLVGLCLFLGKRKKNT